MAQLDPTLEWHELDDVTPPGWPLNARDVNDESPPNEAVERMTLFEQQLLCAPLASLS